MERPPLPRFNSNPVHTSKHRLLLSGKQRRDPKFRRRRRQYFLQESVRDE